MEKEKNIKIKPGFVLRKIANADIIVPIGSNIANFNGLITLNETAAFLFRLISQGSNISKLMEALINEYQIEPEVAKNDLEQFISELKTADMLIEM